jgi:hypothetical protein
MSLYRKLKPPSNIWHGYDSDDDAQYEDSDNEVSHEESDNELSLSENMNIEHLTPEEVEDVLRKNQEKQDQLQAERDKLQAEHDEIFLKLLSIINRA